MGAGVGAGVGIGRLEGEEVYEASVRYALREGGGAGNAWAGRERRGIRGSERETREIERHGE